MKKICVLGVTGSIGVNVCDVCKNNPSDFEIIGVSLNSRIEILFEILKEHKTIKYVYVTSEENKKKILAKYPSLIVYTAKDDIVSLIDAYPYDLVVNALVGFFGLKPTIFTIEKGIDIALANKESLVVGGDLINKLLIQNNCHLYPIDSEHVALHKCLKNHNKQNVKNLLITASGGSFRNLSREELKNVTVEAALNHPSWKMGAKITIDSATMMNKGFEIIEAYHLFHIPLDNIKVLLHDESVIHSLVELCDHSLLADLGPADMRIPITYALYECNYHDVKDVDYLSLDKLGSLHFRVFDENRYPAVRLAKKALIIGGSMPCVLNGANDACNLAFREGRLPFYLIEEIIEKVMNEHQVVNNPTLDDFIRINKWANDYANLLIMKGV